MPDTDLPFARVLIEELEFIKVRREKIFKSSQSKPEERRGKLANEDPKDVVKEYWAKWEQDQSPKDGNQDELLAAARVKALSENLAGLAFSGGGIRSATFAIGVLQGLASLKLLRFFDVLSTVSGGGYAGGWLATWIRREGDPLNVERQLDFSRIRQGKAVRFSGNRIGIQVAGIVDEELRRRFDQLLVTPADGSVRKSKLQAIREEIGLDVCKGMKELKKQSRKQIIDSVQELIRARIDPSTAAAYGAKQQEICDRVKDLLAQSLPLPEEWDADPGRVVDEELRSCFDQLLVRRPPAATYGSRYETSARESGPTCPDLDGLTGAVPQPYHQAGARANRQRPRADQRPDRANAQPRSTARRRARSAPGSRIS